MLRYRFRCITLIFVLLSTLGAVRSKPPATRSVHPAAPASAHATKKTPPKKTARSSSAHRVAQRPRSKLAPADEYFGRLKMSILGVRNKVKDFGLQVDDHPDQAPSVLNSARFVEDAMRDWARKYPFDYWLPRYAYALENVYEEIPGDEAHKRAVRQINYIIAYFPQTRYAKIGRVKIVDGIPTPDPGETPPPADALQRLALIDGKVEPTFPPAPTTKPLETASPSATASPEGTAPAATAPATSALATSAPVAAATPTPPPRS